MATDELITITGDDAVLAHLLADLDGEFGANRISSIEDDQAVSSILIRGVNLTRLMTRLIEFSRELRLGPVLPFQHLDFSLSIETAGFSILFKSSPP
ncbi:hypothetical protein [Leptolyngbya sp. FACHB-261]|uniref:hypothetical protein n=1 Tax=Leptolyngbya sp. FACHB-261 TaxID=2692806 RepID=UPI001682EC18|nr:hypothetical protein [Leptolyngbya sp. FACHB-261]MBD2101511.1 hypothetical protein [Leptolyngbya sp. FACHB-261]